MASRWAYEALSVAQFKYNDYEEHFFPFEKNMSQYSYNRSYLVPRLEAMTKQILRDSGNYQAYKEEFEILQNETNYLQEKYNVRGFALLASLNAELFNVSIGTRFLTYLGNVQEHFQEKYEESAIRKDSAYSALTKVYGKDGFYEIKKTHFNESISDLVENRNEFNMIIQAEDRLIQKKDPIYMDPYNHFGRAHFYAPVKIIGNLKIDTVLYNVIILWIMIGILYMLLLDDTLRKIIHLFSGKKK